MVGLVMCLEDTPALLNLAAPVIVMFDDDEQAEKWIVDLLVAKGYCRESDSGVFFWDDGGEPLVTHAAVLEKYQDCLGLAEFCHIFDCRDPKSLPAAGRSG